MTKSLQYTSTESWARDQYGDWVYARYVRALQGAETQSDADRALHQERKTRPDYKEWLANCGGAEALLADWRGPRALPVWKESSL